MVRLILKFHDDQFDTFDWCVIDTDAPTIGSWQSGSVSEPGELRRQLTLPVVFVIPQQFVYVTEFKVPGKASQQILTAIEYQIEDQLAQDIEAQHYAIGRTTDNKVPVVVVKQAIMLACQAFAQQFGFSVVQIVPEMFLCPWSGAPGEVSLLSDKRGFILRYDRYQCIKCQSAALASILQLLHQQTPIMQINYYTDDEAALDISDTDYNIHVMTQTGLVPFWTQKDVINLQQRQFQATSYWGSLCRVWKSVVIIAIVLFLTAILNQFMRLQALEAELHALRLNQYTLLKDYVEPEVRVDSNLKQAMLQLLQRKRETKKTDGFLFLLLEFSQKQMIFPSIRVTRVGYQNHRLSVDITSKRLNDVEALQAALDAEGLMTDLERLNIKPEQVSGQLILRNGDG